LSVVEKNFELVMVAIVGVSLLPPIWEWIQHRRVRQPLVNADLSGR